MDIHVVNPNDTIEAIARKYGVSEYSLVTNNHIITPCKLAPGESLVIVYPELTYRIKEGDTLYGIAEAFGVTPMELIMNNPNLSQADYIYPGNVLVIKYPERPPITTHGNAFSFIEETTLKRSLPYLTYLSIINYTILSNGEIDRYYDDSTIINLCKKYRVVPLLRLSSSTMQGKTNIGVEFELLLNSVVQENLIKNLVNLVEEYEYAGVNISFQHLTPNSLSLYEAFIDKLSFEMKENNLLLFATISPYISAADHTVYFEPIDYSTIASHVDKVIFMQYYWSTVQNPPSAITSVTLTNEFLEYVVGMVPPEKIIVGIPTIGYDWELPYSTGVSHVNFMTTSGVTDLARMYGFPIQFDPVSLSPFIEYQLKNNIEELQHIIWFIDARTVTALLDLVTKYDLCGVDIWNVAVYNPQLWLIINSSFTIIKY